MKWFRSLKQLFCDHDFQDLCYRGMKHKSLCYKREITGKCIDPITKLPCEEIYVECSKCGKFAGDFKGCKV